MLLQSSMFKTVTLISIGLASLVLSPGHAATTPLPSGNVPLALTLSSQINPAAPNLDVKGYELLDFQTGKVLASKEANTRLAPASLTKLMSMYIISIALKNGNIHWNDQVTVSRKAWRAEGSRMFIKVNDSVSVKDLVQGIIVDSGNDATIALAEHVAGTEEAFVNLMNQEAKHLGMNNTHFMDSTGLPNADHYSTPHDLALLASAIIKNFPEDYKTYSQKWFTYNKIRQPNRNRLLWRFPDADGLKTGHTDEAGYCLVASAIKNNRRLISVVMGAPSDEARTDGSSSLLTYGFRFFETHKLYDANTALATTRIWKGAYPNISIGIAEDLYTTIPVGQNANLHTALRVNNFIEAPVQKGQILGRLTLTLNQQVLTVQPLIALQNDPMGSLWQRLPDDVHLYFQHWFSSTPDTTS